MGKLNEPCSRYIAAPSMKIIIHAVAPTVPAFLMQLHQQSLQIVCSYTWRQNYRGSNEPAVNAQDRQDLIPAGDCLAARGGQGSKPVGDCSARTRRLSSRVTDIAAGVAWRGRS